MRRLRNKSKRELQELINSIPREPKITIAKIPMIVFWCFCGLCFSYSFLFAQDVLFDMKLPILLAVLLGLIGVLFTKTKEYYIFAFIGYGSLVFGVPMMVNNMFLGKRDTTDVKLKITAKYPSITKTGGSVHVTYNGHGLGFGFPDKGKIRDASYVVLTLTQGRLGYYIITDKRLAN